MQYRWDTVCSLTRYISILRCMCGWLWVHIATFQIKDDNVRWLRNVTSYYHLYITWNYFTIIYFTIIYFTIITIIYFTII